MLLYCKLTCEMCTSFERIEVNEYYNVSTSASHCAFLSALYSFSLMQLIITRQYICKVRKMGGEASTDLHIHFGLYYSIFVSHNSLTHGIHKQRKLQCCR